MVGRDEVLAWLLAGARISTTPSRTLVLSGPEGSGKTRLLNEVAAVLAAEDNELDVVRASGVGGLTALNTPLGQTRRVLLIDDLDHLPGACAPEVAQMLTPREGRAVVVVLRGEAARLPLRVALEGLAANDAAHVRGLSPLSEAAVAAIARRLSPRRDPAEVSAFAQRSGPMFPAEALEKASRWALEWSSSRVAAAAAELRPSMSDWERGRDVLVSSLVDFTHVLGQDSAALSTRCPYLGLNAFSESDSPLFFGREEVIARLLARLAEHPLTVLVGPSGVGKSSLLRAGLLPALRAGALPGSMRWQLSMVNPSAGPDPFADVDASLAATTSGTRLLIIDQVEMMLATGDVARRRSFLDHLVTSAHEDVRILVSVRADFYGQLVDSPRFAHVTADATVLLGSLGVAGLRRVVEGPAVVTGLRIEPHLTEALLADTGQEAGALPLLSSALLAVWQRRSGNELTLEGYRETGGVSGAVARLAEQSWAMLTTEQQKAAEQLLVRLAFNAPDGAMLARLVPLTELRDGQDAPAGQLVEAFVANRLLTVEGTTVTVAHEALLREWPRLRDLLERDRRGRELRGHLTPTAAAWHSSGRPNSDLYRGARLQAIQGYASVHADRLSRIERDFVAASTEFSLSESRRSLRWRRLLAVLCGALAVLLMVAVGAAGFAAQQRSAARARAVAADADRLAALASDEVTRRADVAMLLAAEGFRRHRSIGTRGGLFTVLGQQLELERLRRSPDTDANDMALTPDGTKVVSVDQVGVVRVHDLITGRDVGTPLRISPSDGFSALAMSPDGRYAAVGRLDGVLALVDVQRAVVLARVAHSSPVAAMTFSLDGDHFYVALQSGQVLDYTDDDLRSSVELTRLRTDPSSAPTVLAAGPGGRLAVASAVDGAVMVVDGTSGRRIARIADVPDTAATTIAWAVDGRRLAMGTYDGQVRVAGIGDDAAVTFLAHPGGTVMSVAFTSDGSTLVTAGSDGAIARWHSGTGQQFGKLLKAHTGYVQDLIVDVPGGRMMSATAQEIATWRRWPGLVSHRSPPEPPAPMTGLAVSGPDVVTGDAQGAIRWAGQAMALPGDAAALDRVVLASSPDGSLLAVSGWVDASQGAHTGAPVLVLDAMTHTTLLTTRAARPAVHELAFSPDGRTLALGEGGEVELVDVRTGRTRQLGALLLAADARASAELGEVHAVAFSRDGSRLLVGTGHGRIFSWDLPADRPGKSLQAESSGVADIAISPDGDTAAVVGIDGSVRLAVGRWHRTLAPTVMSGLGVFASAVFAEQGRVLAGAGADGSLRLVDVATRKPLGRPAVLDGAGLVGLASRSDGRAVLTGYSDGRIVTWPLDAQVWMRAACTKAGRNLTRDEWRQLVGGPYHRTCARWPPG